MNLDEMRQAANADLDTALRSDADLTRRLEALRQLPAPTWAVARALIVDAVRAGNQTVVAEASAIMDMLSEE